MNCISITEGSWKVETLTGKEQKKMGGLDVVVVLCGDQGETEPIPMVTTTREVFKPGNFDNFKVGGHAKKERTCSS